MVACVCTCEQTLWWPVCIHVSRRYGDLCLYVWADVMVACVCSCEQTLWWPVCIHVSRRYGGQCVYVWADVMVACVCTCEQTLWWPVCVHVSRRYGGLCVYVWADVMVACVYTCEQTLWWPVSVRVSRRYGGLCVAADEKWCELFDRCYTQLLGTTFVSTQVSSPTPDLSQRVWQNIAAILNNASTSSYRSTEHGVNVV